MGGGGRVQGGNDAKLLLQRMGIAQPVGALVSTSPHGSFAVSLHSFFSEREYH